MVLSAKMVAQSLTVDWLSKAPWVSISTTATYRTEVESYVMRIKNPLLQLFFSIEKILIKHKYLQADTKKKETAKRR